MRRTDTRTRIRGRRGGIALLLLLAACQRSAAPNAPAPDPTSGSGLERAAIETGVVADVSRVSPVGLYSRRHEAGSDTLCVMPAPGDTLRFGAQAMFGPHEYCRGRGTARRTGDKLILSFAGAHHCIIVAQYDGDRIAMPGVVDMKCNDLCKGRGTLEGVSFPRVASEAGVAARARDLDGEPLCTPR
ncbi:MAG: hypothetical protein ABW048_09765 [Sphingobium sp.]